MKTKYPRHPEMMKRRMERMAPLGMMARIPSILVLESKCNLNAYYGGYVRSGLTLIRDGVYFGIHNFYWHWVYRICDLAGWTKLREFQPGSQHKIRHGGQCSYLNCDDMDCIDKSIPGWFQRLTRMPK